MQVLCQLREWAPVHAKEVSDSQPKRSKTQDVDRDRFQQRGPVQRDLGLRALRA